MRWHILALVGLTSAVAHIIAQPFEGYGYYVVSGGADFAIVTILASLEKDTDLTVKVMALCTASIVSNAVGALLWLAYYPPTAYSVIQSLIYLEILRAVVSDKEGGQRRDARGFEKRSRVRMGELNIHRFNCLRREHRGQARTTEAT